MTWALLRTSSGAPSAIPRPPALHEGHRVGDAHDEGHAVLDQEGVQRLTLGS